MMTDGVDDVAADEGRATRSRCSTWPSCCWPRSRVAVPVRTLRSTVPRRRLGGGHHSPVRPAGRRLLVPTLAGTCTRRAGPRVRRRRPGRGVAEGRAPGRPRRRPRTPRRRAASAFGCGGPAAKWLGMPVDAHRGVEPGPAAGDRARSAAAGAGGGAGARLSGLDGAGPVLAHGRARRGRPRRRRARRPQRRVDARSRSPPAATTTSPRWSPSGRLWPAPAGVDAGEHGTRPLSDVIIHEQDLRGALGVPGGQDPGRARASATGSPAASRPASTDLPPIALVGDAGRGRRGVRPTTPPSCSARRTSTSPARW